jgi:hypothetical protein
LLGADTFPDVSTALSTISVGPSARQYVTVAPYPITPSSNLRGKCAQLGQRTFLGGVQVLLGAAL